MNFKQASMYSCSTSTPLHHAYSRYLILRSRMWLFPGVCGGPPRVSKRSDHEAARRAQAATWEQTQFIGGHHKFAMMDFLKWCQFPEFRILFRALETFPWARVGNLKDSRKADHIQGIAQHQVLVSLLLRIPSSRQPKSYSLPIQLWFVRIAISIFPISFLLF